MLKTQPNSNIYADFIKQNVPRVLTQIDREEHSPTFGSCDRNFWHLKTRDFSSAILQQSGLTLALLYTVDFPGNEFYQNKNVYRWAVGTLEYWQKIQLKDGSFNEYFPNEHGFPPTAFTLFSTVETYKRLNLKSPDLIKAMAKTAQYLVRNYEKEAINQEIASITSLFAFYSLTREQWVKDGLETKLRRVLQHQSEEGWFPEYGGADFGYLSVSIDMLAEYYWQSQDERIIPVMNKIVDFIKYFCHPDGTIGGEYGSRNTSYFLPNGLQVMCNLGNRDAVWVRNRLFGDYGNNYFQNSIDDRYLTHYVLHSFLRACEKEKMQTGVEAKESVLPESFKKNFKEAGLLSIKNDYYHMVVGCNKGAIVKVFIDGREMFGDFGYRIRVRPGCIAVTNWIDHGYITKVGEDTVSTTGLFNLIRLHTSTPLKHLALRVLSLAAGKHLMPFLKKQLILINKHYPVKFHRLLTFSNTYIEIVDLIESETKIARLESANSLSLRHVASGKFYKSTELIETPQILVRNFCKVRIVKKLELRTGEITVEHEIMV